MQCSCRATPPLAQPWGPAVCQVPAPPSVTAVVVLGYGDKPLLPSQGAFEPSCSQACFCTPPREALPWPAGPGSVFLLNPFPPVKLSPAAWRRWWDVACGFLLHRTRLPSCCSPEAVGPAGPRRALLEAGRGAVSAQRLRGPAPPCTVPTQGLCPVAGAGGSHCSLVVGPGPPGRADSSAPLCLWSQAGAGGVRPRESAKQAVWALVFVSVAAGATLPSTHLSCRPAGPRHGGCGRRGGALSWQEPTLPSLREEKPGEVWGQWGPCPASTYSLLSVRPNNKREKEKVCSRLHHPFCAPLPEPQVCAGGRCHLQLPVIPDSRTFRAVSLLLHGE